MFLCLAGLLPLLAGAFLVFRERPLDVTRPLTAAAAILAGAGWLLALEGARRARAGVGLALLVAAGALVLRGLALAGEPEVSDDLHRYVWEGALLAEGASPYAHAPADAQRARERERWPAVFARVNHPEVPAAYPPLTLLVQAALVRAAGGAEEPERARAVLRLAYGLCDLALCVPLLFLLRARRGALAGVVAWAWNPWVALEFAGAGHFDALGILLFVTALAVWPRPFVAALALASGAAVKLLPLALVPFALRCARPWRMAFALLVAGLLPVVAFTLLAGEPPRPRGLAEYAFRWESFNLVHRWLEAAWARVFAFDEGWSDPRRLARACALGLWVAPLVQAFRARLEPARVAFLAVGGFLVLTPTLHPWYVCWAVPFLALYRARAFEFLAAVAPLLYWPLAGWRTRAVWHEPAWLWPLVAGPFFVLLWFDLRRARAGR